MATWGCFPTPPRPTTCHDRERGNRKPKAPSESRELLDKFIAEHFDTPRQAKAASVYRAYQRACEQQNLTPLSRSTFYQRLKQRRSPRQIRKRKGAKVAYAEQPWHWELTYTTPRHGDRPSLCLLPRTLGQVHLAISRHFLGTLRKRTALSDSGAQEIGKTHLYFHLHFG